MLQQYSEYSERTQLYEAFLCNDKRKQRNKRDQEKDLRKHVIIAENDKDFLNPVFLDLVQYNQFFVINKEMFFELLYVSDCHNRFVV